jgi:saccharopepsin
MTDTFNPALSSTYKSLSTDVSWEVNTRQYGDGSLCDGVLSKDVISIGSNSSKLSAFAYFALVTSDSGTFSDMDGILGLGFKYLSDENPTFIDVLQEVGAIKKRIFGLYLNTGLYNESEYGSPASNLQIGGYDLQAFSTSSSFEAVFNVSEAAWWTVEFTSCSMNGKTLATNFTGIFDSGTSLSLVGSGVLTEILNYLVKTQGRKCGFDSSNYVIICEDKNTASLPGLTLTTSTGTITGAAKYLWECDSGQCVLLIAESDMWLFGDSFLRTYYTVYDMDHLTISFAPAVSQNSKSGSERIAAIGFLAFLIGFS